MLADLQRSSTHKRAMDPRDYDESTDLEDDTELLESSMEQETENPPWKLSIPHVLVATIVPFLFGYHLGVVNEPLETISVDLGFHGHTLQEGLVVSTCLAGAFVGSLISGWVADEVGRRRAFQLCALPMLIGAPICATSRNLTGMLVGRILVGIGLGIGPPVASLYVTEISPAHVRGTYGSFIQIATCLGLMAALVVGIPVRSIFGWWRFCFWMSIFPASMLALLMAFCAESPHWLYKQGRHGEAENELEKLLGASHAKDAIVQLSKTQRGDEIDTIKLAELLCGRHSRVVFIGSTLFALQQLSGINAVFYFSSTVFRRAGVSSNLANVCVGIANLIGSFIALALMDKLGRKALLLWSFFGMAASAGLQVLAAASPPSNTIGFLLSVGGMMLFVLMFAVGAGPVPGLLLPEIFDNRIRAKAMAFCMSVHWVANFLVGLLFLRLLDRMGPQLLYSMFGSFCLLAVVFVKQNVLETKGKSLQEIEIALLAQDQS
ncbi:probable plastidic glucose transporter 2 [Salvia splendens]|uniref:probable plastidic glucose transporter 2 n=1 Tax=Salvia splendens TaxID=180675 RepID=UPI001C2757F9|nr:probable plastidic glucose transporter 2 [Salvia splendens]XP_041994541.1 probable plastidic glucose transporter 2 [Salvia splendens]